MSTELEIDLYSGRPNPRVVIDSAVETEILNRLRALPRAPEATGAEPGLGYRGVRIIGSGQSPFTEIDIFAEVVTVHDAAGARRTFADADRRFERWLLEQAAPHLPADAREVVSELIARMPRR